MMAQCGNWIHYCVAIEDNGEASAFLADQGIGLTGEADPDSRPGSAQRPAR